MESQETKCVLVLDEALPLGLLANTAAILGITLGSKLPDAVGPEVVDKSGTAHLGIIQFPVPILKADAGRIKTIRQQLYQPAFASLLAVDFSDAAQCCNVYEAFVHRIAQVEEQELIYFGVGICGPKKLVNKLTGNLPLLR